MTQKRYQIRDGLGLGLGSLGSLVLDEETGKAWIDNYALVGQGPGPGPAGGDLAGDYPNPFVASVPASALPVPLPIDAANGVFAFTNSGAPVSTTAPTSDYYADTDGLAVYESQSTFPKVWAATLGNVTSGAIVPTDPVSAGDYYIQIDTAFIALWTYTDHWTDVTASTATGTGAPVNGADATYAGEAGAGSLLIDILDPAKIYREVGDVTQPVWVEYTLTAAQKAALDAAASPSGSNAIATVADVAAVPAPFTGDGPPASTTGVGQQIILSGGAVYDAGADLTVPDWTIQLGSVASGTADPTAGLGFAAAEGDYWIQVVADVPGFALVPWIKGSGSDTDWSPAAASITSFPAAVSAADAFGVGVSATGSRYINSLTGEGFAQVGAIEAPIWMADVASTETTFNSNNSSPTDAGVFRLLNLHFPDGNGISGLEGTYGNCKNILANTGFNGGGWPVGLDTNRGVRIGAMFRHLMPDAAEAAGIRLTWDEVNYVFRAYQPSSDVVTGAVTYTELADESTILAGALVQMLVIGYDSSA